MKPSEIRAAVKAKFGTQRALCDYLGVSKSYVSEIVNGVRELPPRVFEALERQPVAFETIEERWGLPLWDLLADFAAQGLTRADSARALGMTPGALRYHLTTRPELDPFVPVVPVARAYTVDTGEPFVKACQRMAKTHTLAEAAREVGYSDISCFKRALASRGLMLQFQPYRPRRRRERKPLVCITLEQLRQYAQLRLSGHLDEAAARQIGFSANALRMRLRQKLPSLYEKVKAVGLTNSRQNRKAINERSYSR